MQRLLLATGIVAALLLAAVGVLANAGIRGSAPDQRLAALAQVRLSDLPPGWRIATNSNDASDDSLDKCFGKPAVEASGNSSRDFMHGEFANATAVVGVFRTPSEAKKGFTGAASDKIWGCIVAGFKKIDGVTATKSTRFQLQQVGAPSVSRELLVRVENQGAIAFIGIHFNVAWKHRGSFIFMFMSLGRPALTLAQESLVVRHVVARLP